MNKNVDDFRKLGIDYSSIADVWNLRDEEIDSKFKKGETVLNKRDGNEYKIKGVNEVDENEIEYALEGYPFLVWEEELEKL